MFCGEREDGNGETVARMDIARQAPRAGPVNHGVRFVLVVLLSLLYFASSSGDQHHSNNI